MGHRAHSRFLVIAGGNGIYSVHGYPHRTHGSPDICQAITDSLHTGRAGAACPSSFPVCYRFQVHVHTFSQNALGDDFLLGYTKPHKAHIQTSCEAWDQHKISPSNVMWCTTVYLLSQLCTCEHIHIPAVKRQRVVQAGMYLIVPDVPVYLCTCVPVYLCTCVPEKMAKYYLKMTLPPDIDRSLTDFP